MDPQSLKKINAARKNNQTVILLTEISAGSVGRDRVIYQHDKLVGEMGRAVDKVFATGKANIAIINGCEFFLNLFLPITK